MPSQPKFTAPEVAKEPDWIDALNVNVRFSVISADVWSGAVARDHIESISGADLAHDESPIPHERELVHDSPPSISPEAMTDRSAKIPPTRGVNIGKVADV